MTVSGGDMLAMARNLPIPVPWDRDEFAANLAEMRGRPIKLYPHSTAVPFGGICGVWLAREDDDVILYHEATSDYHIDHIVRHEIGHMMLGHCRSTNLGNTLAVGSHVSHEILPNLDPGKVVSVLGRHDFDTPQERDAEMFASMILVAAREASERTSVFRSVFFRQH